MWYEKTSDDHSNVDSTSLSWIISSLDLYFSQKGPFLTVSLLLILKYSILWGKLGMLETKGALRDKIFLFLLPLFLYKDFKDLCIQLWLKNKHTKNKDRWHGNVIALQSCCFKVFSQQCREMEFLQLYKEGIFADTNIPDKKMDCF